LEILFVPYYNDSSLFLFSTACATDKYIVHRFFKILFPISFVSGLTSLPILYLLITSSQAAALPASYSMKRSIFLNLKKQSP